eukprot:Phypoly_transcript_06560.p1 GENE.Phypoly_transcript_06560~~Phypoly_transcript_06560.p1  ORF type:complete len:420 (+),score=103.31 Phypoly_transcript_06560:282-1541(+)
MPLAQTIGLETLSKYFHLPINDVAKELGVCATVLKKICRKNGIPRWPHRKIKSLDKMIMTLEVSVAKNPEDGERIRHEIHTLKNKKMFLMKNPNVLATKAPSMKKGMKKGDKSPIDSPESPSNRPDHPPYHPYAYPYAYADHPMYNHMYANYNMYSNPAMKGVPPGYPYYPYPPHYPEHMMEHRRPSTDSEECLSPSMVLDPVAAALFLQIPHPHIPHPSGLPRRIDSPSSTERPQWVPTDPSAFTPKSLRAKLSPTSAQAGYLPDLFADQQAPHMVPQQHPHLSPQHVQYPHHSPSHHSPPPPHTPSGEYLIQLPELRLPGEKDKPKQLSTLEPTLFHQQGNSEGEAPSSPSATPSSSSTPPTSPPPPSKWQLPEWFEAERKDSQQRHEGERESEAHADGEVCVPSDRTPASPLSVGE